MSWTDLLNRISKKQGATGDTLPVEVTGSKAEAESLQDTQLATVVETYNRAAGATEMELYIEEGYVRVRTDGSPCTSTTGEPIGKGFAGVWAVASLSVYYMQESVVTVVSR